MNEPNDTEAPKSSMTFAACWAALQALIPSAPHAWDLRVEQWSHSASVRWGVFVWVPASGDSRNIEANTPEELVARVTAALDGPSAEMSAADVVIEAPVDGVGAVSGG